LEVKVSFLGQFMCDYFTYMFLIISLVKYVPLGAKILIIYIYRGCLFHGVSLQYILYNFISYIGQLLVVPLSRNADRIDFYMDGCSLTVADLTGTGGTGNSVKTMNREIQGAPYPRTVRLLNPCLCIYSSSLSTEESLPNKLRNNPPHTIK